LKFRHIIEKFSFFLLSILLCSILNAQDLEEVLPRKVEVSIIDYSEDLEPSLLLPEIIDSNARLPVDSQYLEIASQVEADHKNIVLKEVQLGMILRNAYYQKITTPRWAKILSTQSWRASFLKWRYYAQLEDYIRSSTTEVMKMKSKPTLTIPSNFTKQYEVKSEEGIDTLSADLSRTIDLLKETLRNKEDVLIENSKETTEEEIFDNNSVAVNLEPYLYSLTELTLPDSIISERILYPKELVRNEIEAEMNPKEAESIELDRSEEGQKKQVKEIVSSKVEESKLNEPELKSQEGKVYPKVVEEIIVSSTVTEKNVPKPIVSPAPTVRLADRRTITEQFAGMYSKLPWPIDGGSITDRYGYRRNAEARGLKSENYGIDVSAPSASQVKAVFSGTVLMALKQAPYDYIVTLKHGDFTSAYYFLNKVNVQVGDIVVVGQKLGNLRQEQGMAPFHFEIWQDQERINPEPWLKR
jgi:murein DD-endopeptidase MepM/ murein hydrolase activator NlpD